MPHKVLGSYKNGTYSVTICEDGTKIRASSLDIFEADFPESIDMKISNRCDRGCAQCHEESTKNGKLANLNHPLLESLHPYTELALGGGNVLEHPDLIDFLKRMAARHIICNITLHLQHFLDNYDMLLELSHKNLIHGVGVSINTIIDDQIIEKIKAFPHVVIHTIVGIMPWSGYAVLASHGLKLLILGYKIYGRGVDYYFEHADKINENARTLQTRLPWLFKNFAIVSFDNLALSQLGVKNLVDEDTWNLYYMGDDGQYTMYIDLVEETYATSSTSIRMPIDNNDIKELFKEIK